MKKSCNQYGQNLQEGVKAKTTGGVMLQQNQQNNRTNHLVWMDNLRTFIVFLVVLLHAGGVYEASGTWAGFWIVDDPAVNKYSGLIFLILDIFLMPALFFISGYLAPVSLARKSGWQFIRSKFRRLMVPWLIAVLTLIPLYKVIFLASRGLPQQQWITYFHFSNGIWGMNWLWFLPALFATNLIYLAITKIRMPMPRLSLVATVAIVFSVGLAYSLFMDFNGLRGWTKIIVMDFQNERALMYLLAFLLGARFFTMDAFSNKPRIGWLYYLVNGTNWIPVTLYIVLLLIPWMNPGSYIISESFHRTALWLNFHLSLLSFTYILIHTFRRYFDREGTFMRILNRNSYAIYIVHVVVQGMIAWGMLQLAVPSLAKHLILAVSSYAASCLLVSAYHCLINRLFKNYPNESKLRTSPVPDDLMEHGAGSKAG